MTTANAIVKTFAMFNRPPFAPGTAGGQFLGGEHLVKRRIPLGVEHARREHPAIHPPRLDQFEQVPHAQRRAAGGIEVTIDRSKEQSHGAPRVSRQARQGR